MAVSTTEAEYTASAQASTEAFGLKKMLGDFGIKVAAVPIYTDSCAHLHRQPLKLLKHINSFNHVKANSYHTPLCKGENVL